MDVVTSYFQLGPAVEMLGYGLAGLMVVLVAIAIWALARSWHSASGRLERLDRGIAEFEARQHKRIADLESELAEVRSEVEMARRQLRLSGVAPLPGSEGGRPEIDPLPVLPRRTQGLRPIEGSSEHLVQGSSNIVHLHDALNRGDDGREAAQDASKLTKKIKEAIGEGKVAAWYQPVIALPGRAARYFEAQSMLDLGGDEPAPAEDWLASATKRGLAGEVGRQMLVECFCLARRLRRDKHDGVVIWTINRSTISDSHDRERIDALLIANASLGRKLLVGVTVADYRAGNQVFLDFLNHVRETGFELALLDGNDIEETEKIVATGLFRLAALNGRAILARGSGRHNSAATRILAADPRQKIEIAAVEVESEENALELIDCDVLLAQGLPFSGPKPLNKGGGGPGTDGGSPEGGTASRA